MSNELRLKIAKQNAKTERQMGFYVLGMKNVTRVTFSRNAHWNSINTTKTYYAHTKLQA
jgi:hypothetical protein